MRTIKHLILTGVFISLITGCHSDVDRDSAPGPEQLMKEIAEGARYISVDEVADRIINEDPGMRLVDVRDDQQFHAFTLPTAANVPLKDMLDEKAEDIIECDQYDIVFFSNGSVQAERAWMLHRQLGCNHLYIMNGGLNDWAEKILSPQEPDPAASAEEIALFQFRKGAQQYFIGAATELDPEPYVQPAVHTPPPKKIPLKPKKKAAEEEEGC